MTIRVLSYLALAVVVCALFGARSTARQPAPMEQVAPAVPSWPPPGWEEWVGSTSQETWGGFAFERLPPGAPDYPPVYPPFIDKRREIMDKHYKNGASITLTIVRKKDGSFEGTLHRDVGLRSLTTSVKGRFEKDRVTLTETFPDGKMPRFHPHLPHPGQFSFSGTSDGASWKGSLTSGYPVRVADPGR